ANNTTLADLVADLNALIDTSPTLGPRITVGQVDGHLTLTGTALGAAHTLQVLLSDTLTTTDKKLTLSTTALVLPPKQVIGASQFGFGASTFAQGTDRSYLIAQVPPPGWTPTRGLIMTADGPVGVLPALLVNGGEIETGVDFGDLQVIADLDIGKNFAAKEGDLVTITAQYSDPLGREG